MGVIVIAPCGNAKRLAALGARFLIFGPENSMLIDILPTRTDYCFLKTKKADNAGSAKRDAD